MRDAHYRHPAAGFGRRAPTGAVRRRSLLAAGAVALLGLLAARPARAATLLAGEVVQVGDAVSFVVRSDAGRRVRVRLAGVAAPSGGDAAVARRALAKLVFGRRVTLRAADAGASPLLADASVDGIDVAATLVANGWLRADGTRAALVTLQGSAERLRLGVWGGR